MTWCDSTVCESFLRRLYDSLNVAHTDLTPALVEEELERSCTVAQGKEARLVRRRSIPCLPVQRVRCKQQKNSQYILVS